MKREPEENTYFLCRRSAAKELVEKAERERDRILRELRAFFAGDIGIAIYPVEHVTGNSIAGDLTVNGENCRTYDPVDLCFLDLNHLMLKRMIELGIAPQLTGSRKIFRITKEEAQKVIETRNPAGAFITIDDGAIVGIDNTSGDAWTEEFKNIETCVRWLNREEERE